MDPKMIIAKALICLLPVSTLADDFYNSEPAECSQEQQEICAENAEICDCGQQNLDQLGVRKVAAADSVEDVPKDESEEEAHRSAVATTDTEDESSENCDDYQRDFENLDEVIARCTDQRDSTESYCEAGGSKPINGIISAVQNAARAVTFSTTLNPQLACSTFGKVSRTALGALSAYRGACAPVRKVCEDRCAEAVQEYQSLLVRMKEKERDDAFVAPLACRERFADYIKAHDPKFLKNDEDRERSIFVARKKCKGYQKDFMNAATDAAAIYASMQQSEKCDEQVADVQQGFCQQYPDSPVCQSLSNPTNCTDNPSSPFCVCQTNPQDPSCLGVAGLPVGGTNSVGILPGGSGVSSVSGDLGGNGSNTNNTGGISSRDVSDAISGFGSNAIAPVEAAQGSASRVNTAPGGGSANLGGGGGGGSASSASRGGSRRRAAKLSTGSNGFERSRRGSYAFKGGKLRSRGSRRAARRGGKEIRPVNGEMMNLRKYLPGGELDPNRGRKIAVSGYRTQKDGITGAYGPSLFDKVSRRYSIVEGDLYQEDSTFRYPARTRVNK